MVLGYSPPDLQMDAKDGAAPFAFDGRSKMLRGSAWDALADWGFGAPLATLATLQSVVLMNLRKSDIDAVTANASSRLPHHHLPPHPIRSTLHALQSLETIRIFEGKS